MMRIIAADMYRFFCGKFVYITAIAMTAFLVFFSYAAQVAAETIAAEGGVMDPVTAALAESLTAATSVANALTMMEIVTYVAIAVVAVIVASTFGRSTIKNELSVGISRTKLYFSRLISVSLLAASFLLMYVLVAFVVGFIAGGMGDWGVVSAGDVLQSIAVQLLMLTAMVSVFTAFVFAVQKETLSIGLSIAFLLVPMLFGAVLSLSHPELSEAMASFELTQMIRAFANFGMHTSTEIVRAALVGLAYITVSTGIGMALFNRAEIE